MQRSVKKMAKELAEHTCHDLEDTFEQKKARIEEMRSQLVDAEMGLHQFHGEALAQLEGHREVARYFQNLIPQEDSTLRIINTAQLYAQTAIFPSPTSSSKAGAPCLHLFQEYITEHQSKQ